MTTFRIREAAELLGVSPDTMRRWAESGRIEQITDESGRLAVDGVSLARFATERAESAGPPDDATVTAQSLRNRFTGLVTRVVKDTVMAQVEIQAGPHRFVSLLSREAVDELGLEPGMVAVAAVKSTNVSVEIPRTRGLTLINRSRVMRRNVTLIFAAAAAAVLAGCSSSSSTPPAAPSSSSPAAAPASTPAASTSASLSGSITVFAASSLKEAFTKIATQFEAAHPGVTVTLSFGASSALAQQIISGAPADVFASASAKNMDQVVTAGDAANPVNFAKNVMEIAVPPSNPAHIATVADLAKAGVKVALCQPQVPCGSTAAKVFKNASVTVTPVTLQPDVKSVLAQVELGNVDAGVVYVTDVHAAGAKVMGVTIPAGVDASTEYPIAPLSKSANAALAQAFVAYVTSADGQAVLSAALFQAP